MKATLLALTTISAMLLATGAAAPTGAAASDGSANPAGAAGPSVATRDVLLVGNSVSGTVSVIDQGSLQNLGAINVIPDLAERLAAMTLTERLGYQIVRQQEGGDRFVDDMALSPDGHTLYVSRGNLADVIALDLPTHRIRWRFKVSGIHADHMALAPDGSRLVVSATTSQQAQVLDPATGTQVGAFATGAYPHANDYSADGAHIYNSSIGVVTFPQALEFLKGPRQLTVVDSKTLRVIRTYQFAHGIRPAVITADETTMYAQLSYLNGFVEFDLGSGRITRTVDLPFSAAGQALSPDSYPNNSAQHGLAMSGDGTKLCVAGTIDDYVALISRPALTTERIIPGFHRPYWAATSTDGQYCMVSNSLDNTVSIISYQNGQEVARVPVGDYPQRERIGSLPVDVLAATFSPGST